MARLGRSYPISRVLHSQVAAGNATPSDSDTGTGAETESILASLSDIDTGTGTETATIAVSDTDTAAAVESESTTSSGSDSETGAGSESASIGVSDTDSGTATESEGISQPLSDSDSTASATESQSIALTEGPETGTGTDSQSISAALSDSDTSSSTESESISVQVSSTDTAVATESETAGTDPTIPQDSEGAGVSESWSIQVFQSPTPERSLVQGPATLYIAPYGAIEPALSAVSLPPDLAVWTDLGGTLGGVDLSVEQEWIEVELKQLPDKPMRRLKKRRMTIKTSLAEATLTNLGYALNDTTSGSAGTGWSSFAPQNRSEASQLSYSALIVDGWAPGFQFNRQHKRRRLIVRKCLSVDNVELSYSKDGQTVYTVTWSCHYVDSTTPPFRIVDGV